MSESKESRMYRCAVCETAEIMESLTVVPPSGIDDRYLTGGCDYNSYKDHKVTGGVLFDDRPEIHWRSPGFDYEKLIRGCSGGSVQEKVAKKFAREAVQRKEMPPVGGICDDCLKNAAVQALLPRIRGLKIK